MGKRVSWLMGGFLFLTLVFYAACSPDKPRYGTVSLNCEFGRFSPGSDAIPKLQAVSSCAAFAAYLTETITHSLATSRTSCCMLGDTLMEADSAAVPASGKGPDAFTGTNIQEAGVDEPDIVKTDGEYLYVLAGDQLHIAKSWPPTALDSVTSVAIKDHPLSMLLHGDRLAVISSRWTWGAWDGGNMQETERVASGRLFQPMTRITILDVTHRSAPVIERILDLEVGYQSARLLDGRLLFVGEGHMPWPEEIEALGSSGSILAELSETYRKAEFNDLREQVASVVRETYLEDWLPYVRDAKAGKSETAIVVRALSDLWIPTVLGPDGLLSVFSLDLSEKNAAIKAAGVFSRGGVVYANQENLYTVFGNSPWGGFGGDIAISSDMAWNPGGGWRFGGTSPHSVIHKFAIGTKGAPQYAAAGTVPGTITNPFQLSEHQGYLRVATTNWADNDLFVLEHAGDGLEVIGEVRGYGPQETIFSSRFMGDRGFVSTYDMVRLFDPLFTFDLSDPHNPKLMGELLMPGYSDYLHPLGADHLLGVGMFAAAMGEPVTSVQVQIFDVSNFAKPITAHSEVILVDSGQSFSEIQGTHHAFTFYEPLNIFAFPVSDFFGTQPFNGLYAYHVDVDMGFERLGTVNHAAFNVNDYDWWSTSVRRSVIMVGDGKTYLFSVSQAGLQAHDMEDFATPVGSLVFPVQAAKDDSEFGQVDSGL